MGFIPNKDWQVPTITIQLGKIMSVVLEWIENFLSYKSHISSNEYWASCILKNKQVCAIFTILQMNAILLILLVFISKEVKNFRELKYCALLHANRIVNLKLLLNGIWSWITALAYFSLDIGNYRYYLALGMITFVSLNSGRCWTTGNIKCSYMQLMCVPFPGL
jgi:hypothetical protein